MSTVTFSPGRSLIYEWKTFISCHNVLYLFPSRQSYLYRNTCIKVSYKNWHKIYIFFSCKKVNFFSPPQKEEETTEAWPFSEQLVSKKIYIQIDKLRPHEAEHCFSWCCLSSDICDIRVLSLGGSGVESNLISRGMSIDRTV